MDFDDSPAEAEFRAQARAWLDANAPRRGSPGDFASDTAHDDDFVKACKAWQGRLHEGEWAGITWPVEYGGRGLGPAFEQIFHDEQAAYGVSTAMFAVGIGMAGPTIIEHGTDEQKARFLPALLRGEEVWCQLFSEPGAGSDLAGISTRAERDPDGGGWVVYGQKVWTSYARHSHFGILLARTHPDRPKHRGITYFLLDMSTPGIDVRPIRQMNGSAEFNEVFLTDVRVPDDRVLGAEGEGWRVAMSTLASERGLVGTDWPGFAELLDAARARGLTSDPATRQRLAEVYTGEQLLRFLGYRAKTALGRGEPLGPLASSINLFFAGHLKRTGDIVLSVLGADGLVRDRGSAGDADWTFLFLTWPCVRIASGTDEIQRNILGERGLGLPPEPRVDKDVPFRDLVTSATTRAPIGGSTTRPSSPPRQPEPEPEVEGDRGLPGGTVSLRATAPPNPPELVRAWRDSGRLTGERIGWCLDRAADQWPARGAVVAGGTTHSFADLRARANAVARALLASGVGRGDVVTWMVPNGVDAIAVAAAVWRIGAVNNPVVPIYREHELSFVLDQLRPAAVVTAEEHRGRRHAAEFDDVLATLGHQPGARLVSGAVAGWQSIHELSPVPHLPPAVEPTPADDPCLVLYTSGTTAAPKGAVHSSATLLQEVRSMQREWALTWRDVMFMASPVTHITGLLQGLLVPTAVGARSVLADRWEPEECVDRIEAEGATYMAGATPFLQGVVEQYGSRGIARPALRQFTCGGSAVPPHLVEEADALGIAAHRAWGMTEFPTTTLAGENDPLERRAHTDGHRAEAVEVEAVDEDRRPLPTGAEGELRVRGPERMLGYVDAALSAEVVDGAGWFYTGDLGAVDDAGYVTITGRRKDIINRGGEKFSAREIEDLLARHPEVAEVAVVGVPGGRLGERVCAAIVARDRHAADPGALRSFLEAQRIARQKIPEEFLVLDALPRTPAGKVQKFLLVEQWEDGRVDGGSRGA